MARSRKTKIINTSYTIWPILRTIKEAEGVARWNPWLAYSWMEEVRNEISLDKPFYYEFDEAAARINNRWRLNSEFPWYVESDFWEAEDRPAERTYIESTRGGIEFAQSLDLAFA